MKRPSQPVFAAALALFWAAMLVPPGAHARNGERFDARLVREIAAPEGRFLEDLFALTTDVAALNRRALLWFSSDGAKGLHAADTLHRGDQMLARALALDPPTRLESVAHLVTESLQLQQEFFRNWYEALESGRPFVSQLTDEFGYHEGLHRSHRLLLKAYSELRALLPTVEEDAQRAFLAHLRAMDLQ